MAIRYFIFGTYKLKVLSFAEVDALLGNCIPLQESMRWIQRTRSGWRSPVLPMPLQEVLAQVFRPVGSLAVFMRHLWKQKKMFEFHFIFLAHHLNVWIKAASLWATICRWVSLDANLSLFQWWCQSYRWYHPQSIMIPVKALSCPSPMAFLLIPWVLPLHTGIEGLGAGLAGWVP